MKTLNIDQIKEVLSNDERVVFAYLYGSFTEGRDYQDLDIAVFSRTESDFLQLSADLKVALSERTGISPDFFDVRIINGLVEHGDLFSLLYLKQVFGKNELLLDKDFDRRSDFIEKYGSKYRECEGLIHEVLF